MTGALTDEQADGQGSVALAGVVGPHELELASRRLRQLGERGADTLVADFAGATSIDVDGLDVLLDATSALRERGVGVAIVPSWAEEVFYLTGRWSKGA
jgi:hypothetical protein